MTEIAPTVLDQAAIQPPAVTANARVVVFDGTCGLCSSLSQFLIRRDRRQLFQFISIQSEVGQQLYTSHGLNPDDPESLLLIHRDRSYLRTDAAIEIMRQLGGLWTVAILLRIVPHRWRDWFYNVVARNRKRWFKGLSS